MSKTAPPSPHVTPVALAGRFTHDRAALPPALAPPLDDALFGERSLLGMPFAFGPPGAANVVLLDGDEAVEVPLDGVRAAYVLVVHAVEDRPALLLAGFADERRDGNQLGEHVADYALAYAGGGEHVVPILRRFAVQQGRHWWGASAFAAVAAREPQVLPTLHEAAELGDGREGSVTRTVSGRDLALTRAGMLGNLWIYALPNPHPERPLAALVLRPGPQPVAVYAISHTALRDHPLRPGLRRAVRLRIPDGARLNALDELEDVAVDLGQVLSARRALDYDHARWQGGEPQVEPELSPDEVLVEYAAHPAARLHAGGEVYELASLPAEVRVVPPSDRPVRVRIVEGGSGRPVAARLHLHGDAGEYLPPRGHHRRVDTTWFEDRSAELVTVRNQHAYVDGACEVDLPLGRVHVEISRGYEVRPLRTTVEVTAETGELTFTLERVLRWREAGWVTADTHVHFLTPQTALLEAQAEDVNVVNLLASQWGEMFSNVGDFDGATTLGAGADGTGEHLVRVGTENRMQVLGHVSLLGYRGPMIHPLCTGGPSESALGDPLEVSMAEWARRCIDQGGLVVMPHAPNPQLERAANLVLGLVHAVELMVFNPRNPAWRIDRYGIADWYRHLGLGHHVPLVGGSDKMSAAMLLGGIRTYARLPDGELTYEGWMDAVRGGDTFVTIGPLVDLQVEGVRTGGRVELPPGGGRVTVGWRVESVALPVTRVEVVAGSLVADERVLPGVLDASGSVELPVTASTWVALRVRGSEHGDPDDVVAHTSAVQVLVGGEPLFSEVDAGVVLDQIEGALAYVDTLAPRPEARRLRALRATLETAHRQLHQRLHRAGVFHRHGPLHPPHEGHEH